MRNRTVLTLAAGTLILGAGGGFALGVMHANSTAYDHGYSQGTSDTKSVCWLNSAGSGQEQDFCKP